MIYERHFHISHKLPNRLYLTEIFIFLPFLFFIFCQIKPKARKTSGKKIKQLFWVNNRVFSFLIDLFFSLFFFSSFYFPSILYFIPPLSIFPLILSTFPPPHLSPSNFIYISFVLEIFVYF